MIKRLVDFIRHPIVRAIYGTILVLCIIGYLYVGIRALFTGETLPIRQHTVLDMLPGRGR